MEKITEQMDGDNIVFRLIVDGQEVCSAKILPYSLLLNIQTAPSQEGKGYAKRLLTYIEKIAQEHNSVEMSTTDIDSCGFKAVCFFKGMGYRLTPMEDNKQFLEGKKDLSKDSIRNVIQWLDDNKSKLFGKYDFFRGWVSFTLAALILIFISIYIATAIQIFVFKVVSPLDTATVALSLLAVFFAFFSFLAQVGDRSLVEIRYNKALKLRNKLKQEPFSLNEKLYLRALIIMRNKNLEGSLQEMSKVCDASFKKENLLDRMFDV